MNLHVLLSPPKNFFFSIFVILLFVGNSSYGQYNDVLDNVTIPLISGDYSCGTIERSKLTDKSTRFYPGEIAAGDIINYRYLALAYFDISKIATGTKIESTRFNYFVRQASSSSKHRLYIVYNPFNISSSTTANDYEDVYQYYRNTFSYSSMYIYLDAGNECSSPGSKSRQFTNLNDIQTAVNDGKSVFGVTFLEEKLDNARAIIDGSQGNDPPNMKITYYLPNFKNESNQFEAPGGTSQLQAGTTIKVKSLISNNTRSTSGATKITYELYKNQTDNTAIWADGKDVPSIGSGQQIWTTPGELKLPESSTSQTYYIKSTVDFLNNTKEADEDDNIYWSQIKVYPKEPTLTELVINGDATINENTTKTYRCFAKYSNGTQQEVTNTADWSDNSSFADISGGVLTAGSVDSDQPCRLTATFEGMSASFDITIKNVVVEPTLTELVIAGDATVNENTTKNYRCYAKYSNDTQQEVTNTASWSDNSNYANIDNGVLEAFSVDSDQPCRLTATFDGMSTSFDVTIKNVNVDPTLSSLSISGNLTLDENSSDSYYCKAKYSDETVRDVSHIADWSENSDFAEINGGILTTKDVDSDQPCRITASFGGLSTNLDITIKNVIEEATLTSLTINGQTTVDENKSESYSCTAKYSDGSTRDVTNTADWSENSGYADINGGVLSAGSVDSDQACRLTASFGGLSTNFDVTIKNVEVPNNYCNVQDSLALVALYNACNGDNWNDNTNWLVSSVKDWYGVTLENGRVTRLEFNVNNLTGEIPPEIGDLSGLVYLRIYFNNLTGSIPAEIGQLSNLTYLQLTDNGLAGQIPPEIGNLTNLETLYLSRNNIEGGIPATLSNLSKLKYLSLSSNKLSGSIPAEIGNLTELREVSFYANDLSGTLPVGLGKLYQLTSLNVGVNNFSGELPIELFNLTNLTELLLWFNNFEGVLSPDIGKLSKLSKLYINDNHFSGEIPDEFKQLTSLKDISIEGNNFTHLPVLSNLSNVISLFVNENKFDFSDIEKNFVFDDLNNDDDNNSRFIYSPQGRFGTDTTINVPSGTNYSLKIGCGGENNLYQWFFEGNAITEASSSDSLVISSMSNSNVGTYVCNVTNTMVPDLTLVSEPITLNMTSTTGVNGLYENNTLSLHVIGNPVNTGTRLKVSTSSYLTKGKIQIYNSQGMPIDIIEVDNLPAGEERELNYDGWNSLQSGIYLIKFTGNGKQCRIKVSVL